MNIRVVAVLLFILFGGFTSVEAQIEGDTAVEGDLIISEIMYAPAGPDGDQEYIEVYNTTSSPIDLEDWVIIDEDPSTSDPRKDDINSSVVVGSGEFAVLCKNGDVTANGGVDCAYDYANVLSHTNTADYVVLEDPGGTEIDRVHYDESNGWPNATDASLEYLGGEGEDNNDPGTWKEATEQSGDYSTGTGSNLGSPNENVSGGALPVELASFTVTATEERAQLSWRTASETNNVGFAVQHQGPDLEAWTEQAFVDSRAPSGTTTQPMTYEFTTNALRSGRHVFRLKQVDTDGTEHVSEPRTVRIAADGRFRLGGPNPLTRGQTATATVEVETKQSVAIQLYDLLGQRIRTVTVDEATPAQPVRMSISTTDLASGVYVLRATGSVFEETRRMTVVQ